MDIIFKMKMKKMILIRRIIKMNMNINIAVISKIILIKEKKIKFV